MIGGMVVMATGGSLVLWVVAVVVVVAIVGLVLSLGPSWGDRRRILAKSELTEIGTRRDRDSERPGDESQLL